MAMPQSRTADERILYWLSLETEHGRWLKACSKGARSRRKRLPALGEREKR